MGCHTDTVFTLNFEFIFLINKNNMISEFVQYFPLHLYGMCLAERYCYVSGGI